MLTLEIKTSLSKMQCNKYCLNYFQYDAKKRISAAEAMKHPYFRSLGPGVHKLPDSKLSCLFFSKHVCVTLVLLE